MPKVTPFLWFNDQAEEAAHSYCSVFANSRVVSLSCGVCPKSSSSRMTSAIALNSPGVNTMGGRLDDGHGASATLPAASIRSQASATLVTSARSASGCSPQASGIPSALYSAVPNSGASGAVAAASRAASHA